MHKIVYTKWAVFNHKEQFKGNKLTKETKGHLPFFKPLFSMNLKCMSKSQVIQGYAKNHCN